MKVKLLVFIKDDCIHCPKAKDVAEQLFDTIDINYLNLGTPEGLAKAMKYRVKSVPTLLLIVDNEEKQRWVYPDLPKKEDVISFVNAE